MLSLRSTSPSLTAMQVAGVKSFSHTFNGKEDNPAWSADAVVQDYGFRLYSTGIGRFLSVDPLYISFAQLTPYQFASNTPIVGIDLDGLEILTIHSADFTEQFMQGKPEKTSYVDVLAALEEMSVRYGPDFGGYFNLNSLNHAKRFYNSPGTVISESPNNAPLTVLGYSNAEDGTPFYYVLYQATTVAEPQIEVASLYQLGMENQLSGVQYGAAAAVMKYSGFGHFGRALHNTMEGRDPWTGIEGNTNRLLIEGTANLVTLGYGGPTSALGNIVLNAGQEALELADEDMLLEIGLFREAIDVALAITTKDKYLRVAEIIANLTQSGLLTEEMIEEKVETESPD